MKKHRKKHEKTSQKRFFTTLVVTNIQRLTEDKERKAHTYHGAILLYVHLESAITT